MVCVRKGSVGPWRARRMSDARVDALATCRKNVILLIFNNFSRRPQHSRAGRPSGRPAAAGDGAVDARAVAQTYVIVFPKRQVDYSVSQSEAHLRTDLGSVS